VTLRTAFGDAHFEPIGYYVDAAAQYGLAVDRADDLTSETLPTFDRWRANAARHREAVVGAMGEEAFDAFVRSCDILEQFWRDGTFGYGLISWHKTAGQSND
jgi:27-O-demethylrifamycin SV methyltransferase